MALTGPEELLLDRARELVQLLNETGTSLTGTRQLEDKTVYKHKFIGKRPKGGKPGLDFLYAELKVDLERGLQNTNLSEVRRCYMPLARAFNFS